MNFKLKNIATIQSGYHFPEKVINTIDGNYRLILVKDIKPDFTIDFESIVKVNLQKVVNNQLLSKGDILFSSRGLNFNASNIASETKNTIASSQFFIIKLKSDNILPEYLTWYLNEKSVQRIIRAGIGGTNMQILRKNVLEELEIQIPPIEIQKKIVLLRYLSFKEEILMKRKIELKRLLTDTYLKTILQNS